jgi:hypothetical protein
MSCDCNTLVVGEAGVQGPQGLAGINGTNGTNGINAFTTVAEDFTQPAVGDPITFTVAQSAWIAVGQTIYISGAGFYTVNSFGGTNEVNADLVRTDGIDEGETVDSGLKVSPSASATYSDPLTQLTVNGTSLLNGNVTINENSGSFNFRVEGNGQENLLFTDGVLDNVGIRTNSPQTALDVNGTFRAQQTAEFTVGATVNSSGSSADFVVESSISDQTLVVDGATGRVGIGTNAPARLLHVNGAAQTTTLLVNPSGANGTEVLKVLGASSAVPLVVNATTNRVGIKTASPTVELDVTGATAISGNLSVATNVLKVDSSGTFVGINKTTPTVALDVVGATAISGNLSVDTNVLKVDVTGNFVGINKTTPTVALDVTGALAVSGASALTTLGVSGDVSVAGGVLQVDTTNTRVGINDSTPSKTLDVNGTAAFTGNVNVGTLLYAKPGVGLGVNTENPAAALDVTGDANISGDLTVASDDFVVNTTTHKVGINTASPATALDVVGITQSDSGFRIAGVGSSNATLTKFKYATGASGSITPAANSVNSFTIAVTGAEVGDFVQATYTSVPATDPTYTTLFGYVSAADVVTVVISNGTSNAVGAAEVYNVGVLVTKAIVST